MHYLLLSRVGRLWWTMCVLLGSLCAGQAAAQFSASVSNVVLVNATTNADLAPLVDGAVVNLAETGTNLNIRADISPQIVGSVVFDLNGTTYLENSFLYVMYGNVGNNYNNGTLAPGSYTLTVTPYSQSGGSGTPGAATTIQFSVIENEAPPVDDSPLALVLVNATTNQDIVTLGNGATIDLAETGSNLNIRADLNPPVVGSVVFNLNGVLYLENSFLYAMFGNVGDNYSDGTLDPGSYTLTVTAFSQSGGNGTAGPTATIQFTVIDQGDTPPPPSEETLVYRINAGGPAVVNNIGAFAADQFFAGATATYAVSNTTDINGTSDDNIYRSERIPNADGGNFSYQFPAASGQYRVVLHFAELWFNAPGGATGGPGSRRFSVQAEGQTVISNFDMLAQAPTLTALRREISTQVTDGTLNLDFVSLANRAKVAAIEVFRIGDPSEEPPVAPPTANAGPDQTTTLPVGSLTLSGSGTASPGRTLTGLQWTKLSGPSVTLGNANTANLTLTNLSAGSYTFQLTATDNAGATGSDNVNLTVNPAPAPPPSAGCGVFQAQNGLVVMEIESVPNIVNWTPRTSPTGFTGVGFYEYTGPNRFGSPNTNETLKYEFEITQPGKYRVQWRSRIVKGNNNTDHNDNWLRVNVPNANNFYGERAGSSNFTGGKQSGFFKIYTNQIGFWSWQTTTRDFDPHNIFVEFSQPGVYSLEVSGRSDGHAIDRIVLYLANSVSESFATSTARPESPRAACQTSVTDPAATNDLLLATTSAEDPLATAPAWRIYPNPAASTLQISTAQPISGAVDATVVNALGQVVPLGVRQYEGAPYAESFDVRGLAPGVYMLRLRLHGTVYTHRFVKQ